MFHNTKRFSMTYTEQEAPILVPMEYKLMKELGLKRSALHKVAIKELNRRLKTPTFDLVYSNEKSSSNTRPV